MSDTSKLKGSWEEIKKSLPDIIFQYENDIELIGDRIALKGKSGAEAAKDQAAWPVYYGMKKAELDKLVKFMGARVDACRGLLFRKYSENYSKALSERVMDKYINNEPEYLSYYELFLEIEELRDKYSAICDAWDKRGFALRDYTNLKVASVHSDVI